MNFALIANIAMTILCVAVLLQSVKLMRALQSVRGGGLAHVIEALDLSTHHARGVLSDLQLALGSCASTTAVVSEGREMAEELGVMIGIANATADRLLEAASGTNPSSHALSVGAADPDAAIAA